MKRHYNIPVFLPELACPNQCVFCNQSHISGQKTIPLPTDITAIVEKYLQTISSGNDIQIAFFGGSFTGLPIALQQKYLQAAAPFIASGKVTGIRLSTRPDYITSDILEILARYNVQDIELGAQSFDESVLKQSQRGHTVQHIEDASKRIIDAGFSLGLQMMIGLPGDTLEKSMHTAQRIVELGAHSTRIYPTLVIANTELAERYKRGEYIPLSLDEAIVWTKSIYTYFEDNTVQVLRTGLHPTEEFDSHTTLLAGPYHRSFKELVMTAIWHDIYTKTLPKRRGKLTIRVPESQINYAVGYQQRNRTNLKEIYGWICIEADKRLQAYECTYSYS